MPGSVVTAVRPVVLDGTGSVTAPADGAATTAVAVARPTAARTETRRRMRGPPGR